MAVVLNFTVAEVPASDVELAGIILYDCTKPYSTPANEGGWGSPNEATTDATSAYVKFTDPDGTETTITAIYDTLPNTDNQGYKVTADQLGLEKITSGLWTIEYSVTTSTTTYCKIGYFLMKQDILCCLDKQVAAFKPSIPLSENDRTIFDLRAMLCVADINAQLGQQTKVREIMEYVRLQSECLC